MSHGFGGVTGRVRLRCLDNLQVRDLYIQNTPAIRDINVIADIHSSLPQPAMRDVLIVVKDQAVLAVEAIEGTDEAIRRGGSLCGRGAVVVKVCKPRQDLRFDLPAVGILTVQAMERVKASCLAVEADKTIFIERDAVIRDAGRAGISIVALHDPKDIS